MTAKLTTRSGWWEFKPVIEGREDFTTSGALRGTHGPAESFGQLPDELRTAARHADYVIYSYSTPIAWHGPEGWYFPEEKYSTTTSRHQSKIFFVRDWI